MRARYIGPLLAIVVCWSAHTAADGSRLTLIEAVKAGNGEVVRTLLRQGGNVNAREPDGMTALHWAVRADDVETAQLLLRAGANANAANRYGITPLFLAATNGNAVVVDLLLKAGANASDSKPEGETVLMTAARTGDPNVVKALVANGAAVNAREQWLGETALMLAAAENHADAARILIAAGADVNARSAPTNLPDLQWVPAGMSTTVFPKGSWTPLMFAAQQGALDAARVLADAGANLNLVDLDGTTALVFSILNAHYDVAALLVEKGADPNIGDTAGMAALYTAVDMSTIPFMHNRPPPPPNGKLDVIELIEILLAHGANPNQQLKAPTIQRHHDPGDRSLGDGSTPLMRAAKVPDIPVMHLLLAHGADPKVTQRNGTNALLFAAGLGRGGSVGYGRAKSGTVEEAIEAVRLLLDAGLDVNGSSADGTTPLHASVATVSDVRPLVQFLVERGADPNVKNKRGQTPLDAARGGTRVGTLAAKNPQVVELLTKLTAPAASGSTVEPDDRGNPDPPEK